MLLKHAISLYAAAAAKSLQSCPNLSNSMDCSPPGSSVMGFSRQEYLSGVPLPSPIPLYSYTIISNLNFRNS